MEWYLLQNLIPIAILADWVQLLKELFYTKTFLLSPFLKYPPRPAKKLKLKLPFYQAESEQFDVLKGVFHLFFILYYC